MFLSARELELKLRQKSGSNRLYSEVILSFLIFCNSRTTELKNLWLCTNLHELTWFWSKNSYVNIRLSKTVFQISFENILNRRDLMTIVNEQVIIYHVSVHGWVKCFSCTLVAAHHKTKMVVVEKQLRTLAVEVKKPFERWFWDAKKKAKSTCQKNSCVCAKQLRVCETVACVRNVRFFFPYSDFVWFS